MDSEQLQKPATQPINPEIVACFTTKLGNGLHWKKWEWIWCNVRITFSHVTQSRFVIFPPAHPFLIRGKSRDKWSIVKFCVGKHHFVLVSRHLYASFRDSWWRHKKGNFITDPGGAQLKKKKIHVNLQGKHVNLHIFKGIFSIFNSVPILS